MSPDEASIFQSSSSWSVIRKSSESHPDSTTTNPVPDFNAVKTISVFRMAKSNAKKDDSTTTTTFQLNNNRNVQQLHFRI
jgi:hypothetical protein